MLGLATPVAVRLDMIRIKPFRHFLLQVYHARLAYLPFEDLAIAFYNHHYHKLFLHDNLLALLAGQSHMNYSALQNRAKSCIRKLILRTLGHNSQEYRPPWILVPAQIIRDERLIQR